MKTQQQKFHEPTLNYNIRFPQSLYERLKEMALKEHKSISLWINEALEKYVADKLSEGVGK